MQDLAKDPELQGLWRRCQGPPSVLGQWVGGPQSPNKSSVSKELRRRKLSAVLWITLKHNVDGGNRCLPLFQELYCCSYRYATTSQLVLYNRSRTSSSYFSLGNAAGANRAETKQGDGGRAGESPPIGARGLWSHNRGEVPSNLTKTLQQLSFAHTVERVLFERLLRRRGGTRDGGEPTVQLSELFPLPATVVESAGKVLTVARWSERLSRLAFRLALRLACGMIMLVRLLLNVPLHIVDQPGFKKLSWSITRQLRHRCIAFCSLPTLWDNTRVAWTNDASHNASVHAFWSVVCEILVDILVGWVVGLLLRSFASQWILAIVARFGHMLGEVWNGDTS